MVIADVLLKIIDNYNEKGVLILSKDSFQWFNGKRWEYWGNGFSLLSSSHFLINRNKKIYLICDNTAFFFKKDQFIQINNKQKRKLNKHTKLQVYKNNKKINCKISRNYELQDYYSGARLSQKCFGFRKPNILVCDNFIFQFGDFHYSRYDIYKDELFKFVLPAHLNIRCIFKLHDEITYLDNTNKLYCLNTIKNMWEFKTQTLKQSFEFACTVECIFFISNPNEK